MTRLLERALDAIRDLPEDAQDDIAQVLLRLAGADDGKPIPLTSDEEAAIRASQAEATRGDFATDDEVQGVWAKHEW
ncbi:MAG TPA: hypothetical protein VHW66_13025 [Stellaceae bacterium]|jgi:hypothetical protein|nr:hypothetical protein [Stellaceae bacterium]